MEQNYSSTKAPTVASSSGGGKFGGNPWSNPDNIKVDDASSATWGAFSPGQGAVISASVFELPQLPDAAVVDGIQVNISGSNIGAWGSVMLNITGAQAKDIMSLNTVYGGDKDKWGLTEITPADIAALAVSVDANDVSGGDAYTTIQYLTVTVYWHIDPQTAPADVPTRIVHKVYSRDNNYLGELPNVKSELAFSQDINSAGSMMEIQCGVDLRNVVEVDALMTEDGEDLLTEDDHIILAESTEVLVTEGADDEEAIFKNSNIIKSFVYNYWYPNGKLVFSGQVNRVSFSYGSNSDYVNLKVYSDGHDLANYIARGYPFNYTADVSQTSKNGYEVVQETGGKGVGWIRFGQSWIVGAGVTNIGAITLNLRGTAEVTLSLFDAPNGNFLGSVTKQITGLDGAGVDVLFEFSQLIPVTPGQTLFMALSCQPGWNFGVFRHSTSSTYANGSMYRSDYAGGSGGGLYYQVAGDFYFVSRSGVPTTTTTYATQDPITSTMDKILLDYNNRGGKITKRNFQAAGYNVTYTFNMATIFDAMKKVIELSPSNYYAYVDLGTAEMDILQASSTADFSIVRGRDINNLDIALTIEQVKNYLLFTGGEVAGTNLYRDYEDSASAAFYGQRTIPQSDNRVTLAATADAIGTSFIAENSSEQHETQITVTNEHIDISKLVPGKTISFRNFGNFIDDLVLQIVRREPNFSNGKATITLGRLPITLSAEVQRINRELLNEQTANNPSSPS